VRGKATGRDDERSYHTYNYICICISIFSFVYSIYLYIQSFCTCRCEDQKHLDAMLGGLFDDFDLDKVGERTRETEKGVA
jgi:hypothetical protein